ncbi:hypothetical protein [Streptomyces sp. A1547]|uniref:hypothetical protein n=1 Tax=Streptomyces sp. A1547 TaxID=2563105 RepID=UPI00109ECFD3|nr:hypothetical protein [Streptomyces sp. A1547]THA33736.1 hypothetical protein E6W17_31085 [Streptomyces sp. A1547]
MRAEYTAFCRSLPWSVEPHPGWQAREGVYSHRGDVAASPGYTGEQRRRKAAFERRLRQLAAVMSGHPFWSTVEREQVVAARMALKRVSAEEVQG